MKRVGPCIYITDLPRTTPKAAWKYIYRLYRVLQREAEKMHIDAMCFGTGFMEFPEGGDPKHIPVDQVVILP